MCLLDDCCGGGPDDDDVPLRRVGDMVEARRRVPPLFTFPRATGIGGMDAAVVVVFVFDSEDDDDFFFSAFWFSLQAVSINNSQDSDS